MVLSRFALSFVVTLSVVVGGFAYGLRFRRPVPSADVIRFDSLPLEWEEYRGVEERFDEETYEVLNADTTTLRRYTGSDGRSIWLFAAYFDAQNYGEQIHSPRNCLPGGGWQIHSLDEVPVPIPGSQPWRTHRLWIQSGGAQQVMYYVFLTRTGTTASEYRLKFDLARAALLFMPRDALFIRVSTPVRDGDLESADVACQRFLSTSMPKLAEGLPF